MCTALNYVSEKHYFGRNFDWNEGYGEKVVITPRNFKIQFRYENAMDTHFAIIGMGIVNNNYPLYYDGVNEYGLCMAGLNFPDNAVYKECVCDKKNITSYEIVLWVLSQCKTTDEARTLLQNTNIANAAFSKDLSTSPLHWIVSDRNKSIVIEPVSEGLMIYDNHTNVLTNNPVFPKQLENLKKDIPYGPSSESRFKRAVELVNSAPKIIDESECVKKITDILLEVGRVKTEEEPKYTIYSASINATDIIYYYKLYEDDKIYKVSLGDCDISSNKIIEGNVF